MQKPYHIAEWAQQYFRIPNAEYAKLAKAFNPVFFDADDGKHGIRCVTYGGPASSAKIKDSRISGTGMLWAAKGLPGGFIINFR